MTVHHEVNLIVGAFVVIRHWRCPADCLTIYYTFAAEERWLELGCSFEVGKKLEDMRV